MKLKLIWTFEKEIETEDFNTLCSEANDAIFLGYSEIAEDLTRAYSCDDFNLQLEIKEILK